MISKMIKKVFGSLLIGTVLLVILSGVAFGEAASMWTFTRLSDGATIPGDVNYTSYFNDDSIILTEDSWGVTNPGAGYLIAPTGACRLDTDQVLGDQTGQTFNIWISYVTAPKQAGNASASVPASGGVAYTTPGTFASPLNLATASYLEIPQNVTAYPGSGLVHLTWDTVAGATGYTIYKRENTSDPRYYKVGTSTDTHYTDSAASANNYYIMVATASGKRSGHTEDLNVATITGAPDIGSLSPNSGGVGATVTITGTNFGAVQGTGKVYFGGYIQAAVTSWSNTQIVVTVPTGALDGNLHIITGGSYSSDPSDGDAYFDVQGIELSSVSPTSAYRGRSINVTINGSNTNFSAASTIAVSGGITAVLDTYVNPEQIIATFTIPTSVTTGAKNVTVTTGAEIVTKNSVFTVNAPSISTVTPTSGSRGNNYNVRIDGVGSHFSSGTTVDFNDSKISVTGITYNNSTQIIADISILNDATIGNKDLTVTTDLGPYGIETINKSAAFAVTGAGFVPATPTNLTIADTGETWAVPSWDESAGATGYTVSYGTDATANTTQVSTSGARPGDLVNFTWLSMQGLTGGTTYYAKVRADGAYGSSAYSSVVSFTTLSTSLSQPTNVRVDDKGETWAVVAWDGSSGADGYDVSYGTNEAADNITTVATTGVRPVDSLEFTWASLQNLSPATVYYAKVRAYQDGTPKVYSSYTGAVSFETTFTVGESPRIDSISPTDGPAGIPVTITGANFGSSRGASNILFNGIEVSDQYIISWSDTQVQIKVPSNLSPDTYRVTVLKTQQVGQQSIDLLSNEIEFLVTAAGVTKAYPNPFNPLKETLKINVTGSNFTSAANIGIYIYDISARLVWKHVENIDPSVKTEVIWNGLTGFSDVAGDGVYMLRVVKEDSKELISKGKVIVIKK